MNRNRATREQVQEEIATGAVIAIPAKPGPALRRKAITAGGIKGKERASRSSWRLSASSGDIEVFS